LQLKDFLEINNIIIIQAVKLEVFIIFDRELFGKRVRYFRRKKGYTLDKACGMIEIEPASLSSIELGNSTPKVSTVINIMKSFDVSCTALINDQCDDDTLNQSILSKMKKFNDRDIGLLICIMKNL